jgi:phage/plasmid primase-like uncharacterized protein
MADLTQFKAQIDSAIRNMDYDCPDPRSAFLDRLSADGFASPANLLLGKIMRFDSPEDKKGAKSGWAVFYEYPHFSDPGKVFAVGVYGSYNCEPHKVVWKSKSDNSMTVFERQQYNEAIEKARRDEEIERLKNQEEAANKAQTLWNEANIAYADNPYLKKKQVKSFGLRELNGSLIVPIYYNDAITSLQFIKEDGEKRFLTGGRIKGGYYKIDGNENDIYIVEGYSTGASIAMATGSCVYVSFNAGNLYEVASYVRDKHTGSRIVIAGDDDTEGKTNTGRTKAMQVAEGLGLEVVFPTIPTDFNDQHVKSGLESVRDCLVKKETAPYIKKEETYNDIMPPQGFLRDIFDFYNSTNGHKQYGFALQTALALGSIVCSRSFKTNYGNFSSLYLLCVAKSTTGKEHNKTVIEQILSDCNMSHLIAGDGYTSAGAVFSTLLDRPRHIAVIDEFGRYLDAANSNGNGQQKEANTKLMEAISRCHSTMRPPNYSTMTLKPDQANAIKNRIVQNPALTVMAMTTPVSFFKSMDITAIKDGFINRFIISISDAERSVREHKPMMQTPQKIIDWVGAITTRGSITHVAADAPEMHTLTFTDEAYAAQIEFQKYCIGQANMLEKFGMAELPGRTNEMAMRISLIVALSKNPQAEVIEKDDMDWAIRYMRHLFEKTMAALKMGISGSEFEGNKKEILLALREASPDWVRRSAMNKQTPYSKYKPKDLEEILKALVESDMIDEQHSKGAGRPTKEYRAID